MNFSEYPYRKQYGIVKQKISGSMIGTVELSEATSNQKHIWSAQCLNNKNKIIEPETKVYVVDQIKKILLVEPL